jgi:hypothetical protein
LRTQIFQYVLRNGLYCALGAYGHEDRGFYGLVREMDARAARAGRGCAEEFKAEGHCLILDG